MTLRMLPPGGGDGDGPDDGPLSPSEIAAAMAGRLLELVEALSIDERRFAESFAETRDARAAIDAAFPSMLDLDEGKKAARAMALLGRKHVQDYLKAATGMGMIGHGLDYGAVMQQSHMLASDPDTPSYVKAAMLATILKELRESGVAALQGYAPADLKSLGKGDDRQPGVLDEDDVDELEGILFGEEAG